MAAPERYDALVLGSGQGGKLLAWDLARSGRHTAVVERQWIGGSCPNINCMPSKNEIWSANVAYVARHGAEFGTRTDRVAVDMVKVRQRKRDMVDRQVDAHLRAYKDSGTELIMGTGRFVAPKTLEVRLNGGGARVLYADKVFVNVGTHGTIPDVPGLEASGPLTSIEALEFDHVPPHLVVLGGGYVGLEFSQAYRRFGSRVTIIEHGPRLLSQEDPDISSEVQRILSAEGIECLVGAQTLRVHGRSGKDVTVLARTAGGEQRIEGSDMLVAVGRTPNTSGIGLEQAGVELDARGYVRVNDRLETTAPDVWARRMRRDPTLHARLRRRLPDHQRQSGRRQPQHARPADPVLRVHGSATGPRWIERARRTSPGRGDPRGEAPHERRAAGASGRRTAGLDEGASLRK